MNAPCLKFLQNLTLFQAYYFLYLPTPCHIQLKLFTSQLAIKTAQSHGESLKSTHRVIVIHSKHIFSHSAKLHDDVIN